MSYREMKAHGLVTIELTCDARRGAGVCGNSIEVTMQDREAAGKLIYSMGWRLMRGHSVCAGCLQKKNVVFPRKADVQRKANA